MDKNKSQIIFLDKNGLETVAKALSSGCWTIGDSGSLDIGGSVGTSSRTCGNAPQLTLAQGNVRPITQVSGSGGSANNAETTTVERPPVFQRDNSQVATLTELGKKLIAAAKAGNTNQVRRLMAIGAPFASDGPIGMTPLHLAAQNGHYSTCDRLLCAGMNKDAKNKVDKTPLHLAATEGHTNIVLLLVKHGANVNACDMLQMTPLHWACDRGHTSIAHFLLKHNALLDIKNKFYKTPLQLAVETGHDDIAAIMQGGVLVKDECYDDDDDDDDDCEDVEDDDMCVENITLGGSLDIPGVEKIEEVHTEEMLVQEMSEDSPDVNESSKSSKDEDIPTVGSDLPHTILTEDLEDQNISVLATLAELAHSTPRAAQATVEMSNDAALELLKAQAALLDEPSTLVSSAIAHGQTLHLTEAGRQALKLINKELPLIPASTLLKDPPVEEESEKKEDKCTSNKTEIRTTDPCTAAASVHTSTCLPALLPATATDDDEGEGDENQEVTQVITLSPEQYAALTGSTNGPILLQVLTGCEGENQVVEGRGRSGSLPSAKRQKVMQLVTRVTDAPSRHAHPVAKVTGQVLNVDLPGVSDL